MLTTRETFACCFSFVPCFGLCETTRPFASVDGAVVTLPTEQNRLLMCRDNGVVDETPLRFPSEMLYTHGAATADVNGDGALDLFLSRCCRVGQENGIYMNDGSGHFVADDARFPPDGPQDTPNGLFVDGEMRRFWIRHIKLSRIDTALIHCTLTCKGRKVPLTIV